MWDKIISESKINNSFRVQIKKSANIIIMSKTNQKLRPQKTQVSTFTKQQSTALVQNTCLSFVSMVTYLREIFSDDAYEETTYSSATFKTIKKDGGDGSDSKKGRF